MDFRISGLDPTPFLPLYGLSDEALSQRGIRRAICDEHPGYPDRVTLRDAEPGQRVLLLNHTHLPHAGPYRSSHAIFVTEGAERAFDAVNTLPPVLLPRTLSLRAFDRDQMMVDADLVEGAQAETLIARLFSDPRVEYIHAHFARRGCFACRIDRA